jgi:hypothetical protein
MSSTENESGEQSSEQRRPNAREQAKQDALKAVQVEEAQAKTLALEIHNKALQIIRELAPELVTLVKDIVAQQMQLERIAGKAQSEEQTKASALIIANSIGAATRILVDQLVGETAQRMGVTLQEASQKGTAAAIKEQAQAMGDQVGKRAVSIIEPGTKQAVAELVGVTNRARETGEVLMEQSKTAVGQARKAWALPGRVIGFLIAFQVLMMGGWWLAMRADQNTHRQAETGAWWSGFRHGLPPSKREILDAWSKNETPPINLIRQELREAEQALRNKRP